MNKQNLLRLVAELGMHQGKATHGKLKTGLYPHSHQGAVTLRLLNPGKPVRLPVTFSQPILNHQRHVPHHFTCTGCRHSKLPARAHSEAIFPGMGPQSEKSSCRPASPGQQRQKLPALSAGIPGEATSSTRGQQCLTRSTGPATHEGVSSCCSLTEDTQLSAWVAGQS